MNSHEMIELFRTPTNVLNHSPSCTHTAQSWCRRIRSLIAPPGNEGSPVLLRAKTGRIRLRSATGVCCRQKKTAASWRSCWRIAIRRLWAFFYTVRMAPSKTCGLLITPVTLTATGSLQVIIDRFIFFKLRQRICDDTWRRMKNVALNIGGC